ncbi:MAG TPA: ChbG/HpnK family deacetylase [Verrucomicrobiae bacterium]|nr:ChbG/HpnK family deacetylase [Verrucomicrobiae bacterium]
MIIVNADDLGRSRPETDAALACHARGRITAATAMMFMADSERAAGEARRAGLDVGLHLNLDEAFTAPHVPPALVSQHAAIARFLKRKKYALLLYHPLLRSCFRSVYQAQEAEFIRLYGRPPSHVDGHRHRHLCTNLLMDRIIPAGYQMRRSFTFNRGEKGWLNRTYRHWVDQRLQRRYRVTDGFFCLRQSLLAKKLDRVLEMSKVATVELMTHPHNSVEYDYLMSDDFVRQFAGVKLATFCGTGLNDTAE